MSLLPDQTAPDVAMEAIVEEQSTMDYSLSEQASHDASRINALPYFTSFQYQGNPLSLPDRSCISPMNEDSAQVLLGMVTGLMSWPLSKIKDSSC